MYRLSYRLRFSNVWNYIDKLQHLSRNNSSESLNLCDTISNKLYQLSLDKSSLVNACFKLSLSNHIQKNLYLQLRRSLFVSINDLEPDHVLVALSALMNFHKKGLLYKNLLSENAIKRVSYTSLPQLLESISVFKPESIKLMIEIEQIIRKNISKLSLEPKITLELIRLLCICAPTYKILLDDIAKIIFIQQSDLLSTEDLIDTFYYLGKIGYYPSFHDKINEIFMEKCAELDYTTLMKLLYCYNIHYSRFTPLIEIILKRLKADLNDNLALNTQLLYNLYKLRIYDEFVINHANSLILSQGMDTHDPKDLINYLTAITFFKVERPEIYNKVVPQLTRHLGMIGKEGITQLKIIELALRYGHVPNIYAELSEPSRYFFQLVTNTAYTLELYETSNFQKEVGEVASLLCYNFNTEVRIGPFMVDYATPMSVSELYSLHNTKVISDINDIPTDTSGVIIEVDGPAHFYKNTHIFTCHSLFKDRILTLMGYKVIHIPYYEWEQLSNIIAKQTYLQKLISA